ncbi:MAG: hypothetical protein KA797_07960, partial [Chitinophagales bacterium]|nr:hypothetical protein [Chitinophagales bacterium]
MKRLLVLFLLSILKLSASHIVGGDMKYKYIGGNSYEVTVIIYRDCSSQTPFDGLPNSQSDFTLGLVQEGNITATSTYTINITSADVKTVYNQYTNPCLTDTNGVCLEFATYKTTITVPNPSKSYYLVYQRCCRNSSINNVVPIQTSPNVIMPGSTYVIRIPQTNFYFNNSPTFNSFPPKFICLGVPFTFNQSATDIDGDSLTYETYTPYEGLSGGNPVTNNPLFDTTKIIWKAPYTEANMMGGTPVTIDENGVLTCTPNQV